MKDKWVKPCFMHGGTGAEIKIAAFDFETIGLGGAVNFATAMTEDDCENGLPAYCFSGADIVGKLFAHMLVRPGFVWFAHNAGYDWRYILRYLLDHRDLYKPEFSLRNDNSIFAIRVLVLATQSEKSPTYLQMRDSYAIWPHTLRELANSFCPDFPKGEIDFGRETFNPDKRAHVEYAQRDVEVLVRGLRKFNSVISEQYGVNLSGTVASTAMRAWERMLDKKVSYWNPKSHEQFVRKSYFGGLVFLTRNDVVKDAKTYDINSSYPYQMREHGAPYGAVRFVRLFDNSRPGIYDVTIGAPENLRVPIIPKRHIRGRLNSVLWPRGIFRTHATSIELDFALARGYRLYEIHEGRVWDSVIHPFDDFVTKAETIRAGFKGRTEEKVAKLIQNSLYGKFGARRERRALYAAADIDNFEGLEAFDEYGDYYVKTEYAEDLCVLPQWAVWITAHARLHLLKTIYDTLGVEAVVYGDTDSITCLGEIPTGKAYGEFKLEKEWKCFRAIAPKVYAGQLRSGEWTGACKGIPSKLAGGALFKKLFEEGIVTARIETLPSLMVTMKSPGATLRVMDRRSTDIANSKNWEQGPENRILPRRAAG
jgi:hypothetical protein